MTVTTTQSQSTPPSNINNPAPYAAINPGVGAPSDDATINANVQKVTAGNLLGQTITPQPNILDDYKSYTYSITWYMLTSEAVKRFQTGDRSVLASQAIIMQSGGIANDQRNPYFDVDFYFDDLRITNKQLGAGTGAVATSEITFTVIEPNGVTLYPRLIAAMNNIMGASASGNQQNISAQNFMIAIRFYGYDEDGNLVQVGRPIAGTSNYALVEKFYPFQFTKFTYKVQNKLVEYHIEGTALPFQVVQGQNQNSLQYNVEVSGSTVKDVLTTGTSVVTGNDPDQQTTTETTRINQGQTPKNTVRLGLVSALNQYQQELVNRGVYTIPNTYVIEFTDDAIADAQVIVKDGTTKGTGYPLRGSAPDKLDPRRQAMDSTVRLIDYTAGQQITQIIDQTIRNSTYISKQSNTLISEKTGEVSPNPGQQPLTWFKINMQAIPKGYDDKRKDYAYTIRYVISKYSIQNLESAYFNRANYNGPHKQYFYWFTGLNNSIIHYEQSYENQGTVLIGNNGASGTLNDNSSFKQLYSPRSNESSQGAKGRTNDIAANAADFLYNMADLQIGIIQIVGDPAWIAQGELVSLPAAADWDYGPFLPDGTINFDGGQVMFEIGINAPADYNLSTGLMDPNTRIDGSIDNVGKMNQPRQRYVYNALEIVNEFVKGKFTQTLKGQLKPQLTIANFEDIKNSVNSVGGVAGVGGTGGGGTGGGGTGGGGNDIVMSLTTNNQTPSRSNQVNNQLALSGQPLNAAGLPVPNNTAQNIKVPTGVVGGPLNSSSTNNSTNNLVTNIGGINGTNSQNILTNLPPKPPTSNGPIQEAPSAQDITTTNNVFQQINRDT